MRGDPLMRRFFEVFLFEDAPASGRRPDEVYLDEVERCDIYVGLFGADYVDAAPCAGATLDDLDVEGMYRFIRIARRARQFPLPAETPPADLLRHLNLLNKGRLSNAAVLLFGRVPQRFLISSTSKGWGRGPWT